jgi:2-oxoglutarate ferredoxin oxidoreductase subunit beta
VLDIISPCVTFNNAPDSTKSYPYGKEHERELHSIDYVMPREEIMVDYAEGEAITVELHDGSHLRLKKLDFEYDPRNRAQAIAMLEQSQRDQLFITGLLYYEEPRPTLGETLNLTSTPLTQLSADKLRPSRDALAKVMQQF